MAGDLPPALIGQRSALAYEGERQVTMFDNDNPQPETAPYAMPEIELSVVTVNHRGEPRWQVTWDKCGVVRAVRA